MGKWVHAISKGNSLKVEVTAQLEFEFAYWNVTVQ